MKGLEAMSGFYHQRHVGLECENRFVLGAMIFEEPAEIFKVREGPYVSNEDKHSDCAGHEIESHGFLFDRQQLGHQDRQEKENSQPQPKRYDHGHGDGQIGLAGIRGGLMFFRNRASGGHFGGIIEGLDSQGQHLKKRQDSPDYRQAECLAPTGQRNEGLGPGNDAAVRQPDRGGHFLGRLHHDTLNNSLPADILVDRLGRQERI